jgi:hypothetical protein
MRADDADRRVFPRPRGVLGSVLPGALNNAKCASITTRSNLTYVSETYRPRGSYTAALFQDGMIAAVLKTSPPTSSMGDGHGDDGDNGAAAALLERARRLCAAANLAAATALPPLAALARVPSQSRSESRASDGAAVIGGVRGLTQWVDACALVFTAAERRLGTEQRVGGPPALQKLPLLPSKSVAMKPTRPPQTQPLVEQTPAQRRQREAEKIRQARERAQARIARSNQQEQQQAQQQVEQQRLAAIEAADKYADKLRLAEEGRLRAQERVRVKRLANQSNQERDAATPLQLVARTQTPSTSLVVPKRVRKAKPAPPP